MAKVEVVKGQDPHLVTAEEFNARVLAWGKEVRALSHGSLTAQTHVYSGRLSRQLKEVVSYDRKDGVATWVGFRFPHYGVFVSYGVGRGWARQGGQVVRARRLKKDEEIYIQKKNKGYSAKELRQEVVLLDRKGKGRKPKDWLDSVIDQHIQKLADIAGEFYGDRSMQHVLDEFYKMKIVKR